MMCSLVLGVLWFRYAKIPHIVNSRLDFLTKHKTKIGCFEADEIAVSNHLSLLRLRIQLQVEATCT